MTDTVSYLSRKIRRPHAIRQVVGIFFLLLLTVVGRPASMGAVLLGGLLSVVGIAIRFWAGGHVRKDKELATTGPYAYVRNPLYVGNVLIALGFCFLSGYGWPFLVFAALYAWLYIPTLRKEERTLEKLFGDEFRRYKREVRAMLPRWTPYRTGAAPWSGAQWVRNGEHIVNGGLFAALIILLLRSL